MPYRVTGQLFSPRRAARIVALGIFVMAAAPARGGGALPNMFYVEVSAQRGIGPLTLMPGMGSGVAAADYDRDGDVDLFVPTADGHPDVLYRNLGNGSFLDMATSVGLASTDAHRSALWFDATGDGLLDLFVTSDLVGVPSAYTLYVQASARQFVDATVAAGLHLPPVNTGTHHRGGSCAGDLNRDGYLDLVTTVWNGPTHVFINNRDGTFRDASVSSGIGANWAYHHQAAMADLNNDGWLDLYVNIDFAANQLWINQQDGTFSNQAAAAGANNAMNDMGLAFGDYDNDGDFDIYVTNILFEDRHNILLRNDTLGGVLAFTEVSMALGVDEGDFGWGTTFLDFDNDRHLDLAATNGGRNGDFLFDTSRLFWNSAQAPYAFIDVSSIGFDDSYYGASLVATDLDRDGDLDLVQTTQDILDEPSRLRLLDNQLVPLAPRGNYIVVKPRMDGPNRYAIGAVCTAVVEGVTMTRLITAGISYLGQEPAEAFFGLGDVTKVDELRIDWPDGSSSTLLNLGIDQVFTVTHGGYGDFDANGLLDDADWLFLADCLAGPTAGITAACQTADHDGSGRVDLVDWARFQQRFAEHPLSNRPI